MPRYRDIPKKCERAIIVNARVRTGLREWGYELLHGDLESLHRLALEKIGLTANNYNEGGNPCYFVPQHLHTHAIRHGVAPVTQRDAEVFQVRAKLCNELNENPDLGVGYALEFEKEAEAQERAEAAANISPAKRALARRLASLKEA